MNMKIDPVCLMEFEESVAAGTSEYKGETYFFCAEECKKKFDTYSALYLLSSILYIQHFVIQLL